MNKKHLLLVIISTFCQFSLAQQNTSSIPSVGSFFTEVGKNANVVSPIYDMEGKKAIDMDLLGQQDTLENIELANGEEIYVGKAAKTFYILKETTNDMPEIIGDTHLYRWNGENYVEK